MNNVSTTATSSNTYDPNNSESVDSFWEGATITQQGKKVGTAQRVGKRGKQATPTKQSTTLRLSPEVITYFKSTGKGWQSRMNTVLEEYVLSQ